MVLHHKAANHKHKRSALSSQTVSYRQPIYTYIVRCIIRLGAARRCGLYLTVVLHRSSTLGGSVAQCYKTEQFQCVLLQGLTALVEERRMKHSLDDVQIMMDKNAPNS